MLFCLSLYLCSTLKAENKLQVGTKPENWQFVEMWDGLDASRTAVRAWLLSVTAVTNFCLHLTRTVKAMCAVHANTGHKLVLLVVLILLFPRSTYASDNFTKVFTDWNGDTSKSKPNVQTNERPVENIFDEKNKHSVTTPWNINAFSAERKSDIFHLNVNECADRKAIKFSSAKGVIYGKSGGENVSRSVPDCVWSVEVPEGYFLSSSVHFLLDPCPISVKITVVSSSTRCSTIVHKCATVSRGMPLMISDVNRQTFSFRDSLQNASLTLEFLVLFEAMEQSVLRTLPMRFTSPMSGYVTSYGFDEGKQSPCGTNASRQIAAPDGHVMMISFPRVVLDVQDVTKPGSDVLALYRINDSGALEPLKAMFGLQKGPTTVERKIFLRFEKKSTFAGLGFKMLFSIIPSPNAPHRLDSGLWDCSVPHYDTFKQHLECNLEQECQGGEDEGPHCPFSSPACNGSIAVGNKCYEYVDKSKVLEVTGGECKKRGGNLASMKSKQEWLAFLNLFEYGKRHDIALTGLKTSDTRWPKYYKYALQWADNTVSYETNTSQEFFDGLSRNVCGFYDYVRPSRAVLLECAMPAIKGVICEYDSQKKTTTRHISNPVSEISSNAPWNSTNVSVTRCPSGHVTHSFLSCDPRSSCGAAGLPLSCRSAASPNVFIETQMFICDDHLTTLPYTLLCDHRPDCIDSSDESFCQHDSNCQQFRCRNGQCIPFSDFCDLDIDCWDGSDEDCVHSYFYKYPLKSRLLPPAVVFFDGKGEFYQVPLAPSQPCPQTHFRCAGESAYCLPVYVRCNGVYDCPSHEDEEDCQHYTCPGFYRCRASNVCVHADNVCDGWPQCPQHDDEMFCGLQRCDACVCQGLAFVCRKPFPSYSFPEMRYLDGTNSGMALADFWSNSKLVWLRLASCGISTVTTLALPNLRILDLSENYITAVDFASFSLLQNLRELFLAGNPMANLLNGGSPYLHKNLESVDLTRTLLKSFDSKIFLNFSAIKFLNISFSQVQTIPDNGFSYLTELKRLDVRNNPIENFPMQALKTARYLTTVFADSYKLCCKQNLPDFFQTGSCFAPADEISSCDDLLHSDVYRVFLWLFCVLAITGNGGCFLFRQVHQRNASVSGFNVFVSNLSVSDFLMGVYLGIIGAADETYRSTYLWNDVQWKVSITCKVAGFLSFLSSEVSALIICLITLDRFIVLRFPFSNFRFDGRSASWACGLAWVVGLALAGVPLLPFFSHWEFYSQNGICIPLPITRKVFSGRSYSFGVMIIFNMFLFVVIAVGQLCIYWSVRMNSMTLNTTKKSRDIIIARRLATVVVSDFLCWFPIGLVSIMAASGIPVPSEVSVAMIIFVLPLNSALNPFLYTFNLFLEKWRLAADERMLRKLESQLSSC